MVKLSNNLIGILNFLTLILSIPVIYAGVWLSHRTNTDCEKFLDKPIILIGVFLLLVSLAGFIGACCRVSWLLWFYLLVMFILICLLFLFTLFVFTVTNKGAGEVVSGRGYKEYRLGDYSNWLQKEVDSSKNWNRISSCLKDSNVCKSLIDGGSATTVDQFYQKHLSSVQSGCCKPPNDCNFTYVTPTNWTSAPNSSLTNPDCSLWNNDPSVLCFSCQSCKAGLLDNIKNDWKKVAKINIIVVVILIVIYTIGCCAFRNSQEYNPWKR